MQHLRASEFLTSAQRNAPEVKALHTISAVSRPWRFLQFLDRDKL